MEGYVEEFERSTLGPRRAREERGAELRAHLAEAQAAGELDGALARLGTPRKAARAFAEGHELRPVALPRRFGAWITDYAVAALFVAAGLAVAALVGADVRVSWARLDIRAEGEEVFPALWGLALALLWYAVGNTLLEWRYGRTAGKAVWGMRVASEDGIAPSFGQVVLRRLPLVFSGFLQLIDWAFVFSGGRNQRPPRTDSRGPRGARPPRGGYRRAPGAAGVTRP